MWKIATKTWHRALQTSTARFSAKNGVTPIKNIRDIGIIAHIDAGKTTTTERMLYYSGKTKRIGNVDQGDTVTDYLDSERERGITIQSAAITISWNNRRINIIDTPGHADFTFEVIRSLRVLDGAVTILDAVEGVEAQTEKVWKQAQELSIPKVAFVNKMDRDGAGFSRTVKEMIQKLQTSVVLVTLPYFEKGSDSVPVFKGVVDVINKTLLVWDLEADASGKVIKPHAIDDKPEILEMVTKSRESMVETLGEFNEEVVDSFLEHDEDCMAIPNSVLKNAIRAACISNDVTPVFCGSAFKNIGVQPLMDGINDYLPSPLEAQVPELTSNRRTSKKKKGKTNKSSGSEAVEVAATIDAQKGLVIDKNPNLTVALAFKVITDKIRGVMTFFRVYSGTLTANTVLINTRTGQKHTVRNLLLMHGDEPQPVTSIGAGNIGVIAGNEEIITGDTLVTHGTNKSKSFSELETNLKLLPIDIPPPLFNSSIEPLTAGDERYMNECIQSLVREDPSLVVQKDEELGQTILSGMGELHLEIIRERLVNDMKAKVKLREVAVSYKETILRPSSVPVKVVDESGISVEISLDSFEGDSVESAFAEEDGAELLDQDNNIVILAPEATPQYMHQAIDERRWKCEYSLDQLQDSLVQGLQIGLQIGGPILGLSLHSTVVRVHGWDFPIDDKSASMSKVLEISRRALLKAIRDLDEPCFTILEPIMETKVYINSDRLGDVTHDLTHRCSATIVSIEDEGSVNVDAIDWANKESQRVYLPQDYTMSSSQQAGDIQNKKVIMAETPLREMVGYLSKLRSLTQGRSTFDMTYLGMRRALAARLSSIKREYQI